MEIEEAAGLESVELPERSESFTQDPDSEIEEEVTGDAPPFRSATEALLNVGDSEYDSDDVRKELSPVYSPKNTDVVRIMETMPPIVLESPISDKGSGKVTRITEHRNPLRKKVSVYRPNKERHFNSETHEFHLAAVRESRANAMRLTRAHLKNEEADSKIQQWLSKRNATQQIRNAKLQQSQIKLPVIGTLSIAAETSSSYDADDDAPQFIPSPEKHTKISPQKDMNTDSLVSGLGPASLIVSRRLQGSSTFAEEEEKRKMELVARVKEEEKSRRARQRKSGEFRTSLELENSKFNGPKGNGNFKFDAPPEARDFMGIIERKIIVSEKPEPYESPLKFKSKNNSSNFQPGKRKSPMKSSKEDPGIMIGGPGEPASLSRCFKLREKILEDLRKFLERPNMIDDPTHRIKVFKYLLALRCLTIEVVDCVWRAREEGRGGDVDDIGMDAQAGDAELGKIQKDFLFLKTIPYFYKYFGLDFSSTFCNFFLPKNVREATLQKFESKHLSIEELLLIAKQERNQCLPIMHIADNGVITFQQAMIQRLARTHGLTVKPAQYLYNNPPTFDLLRIIAFENFISDLTPRSSEETLSDVLTPFVQMGKTKLDAQRRIEEDDDEQDI